MISLISSQLCHSRLQLYQHLTKQSLFIALYLSMPWSRGNNQYRRGRVPHTQSTADTEYGVHCVLCHPIIVCLLLSASLSSCCRPCCTQLSSFPQLQINQMNRVSTPCVPLSWAYWLLIHSFKRLLSSCTIMSSKYISNLTRLQPPRISLNWLDYSLQVHITTATKCISKLAWSGPPSASPHLHHHGR
jgi:hypothetical protein